MVEVRKSRISGKGVFAKRHIKKGKFLTCDVLVLGARDGVPHGIQRHLYPWSGNLSSICIGFGSYINHRPIPNVKIHSIDKENLTKTFIILEDLQRGDELTLDYSGKGLKMF